MRLSLLIIFTFLSLTSFSQAKFYAKADAGKILDNSFLNIEFVLENAEGKNFRAPAFKDFTITGGPSSGSSMTIVNGKVSKTQRFGYELRPNRTGRLRVPSASITVNGKVVKSQPLVIEVIKASNSTNSNSTDPFYVKMVLSDSSAYIGQQVILDYVLYTKVDVRAHNIQDNPEYNGFFAEKISRRRSTYNREIINGEEYYVKVLDRIALFPQQTGNYSFGPYRYRIGVSTEKNRTGLFFNSQLKYYNTQTNSLSIQVRDFTTEAPESFSGAVGAYSMRVNNDKNSITTDDAFTIRMRIDGDGDSRTVNAPIQDFGEGLDVYDPNIVLDENNLNNSKITNSKMFEYIVVPKKAGRYRIQPEFSYFNPDSNKFITLKSPVMTLSVAQGTGVSRIKEDTKISKLEISEISESLKLSKFRSPFFNSLPYWGIYLLGFLAAVYILFLKKKQIFEDQLDPRLKKANLAEQVASVRLAKADQLIQDSDFKNAYAEISNSFKEYLSDKYQIAYSELNIRAIEQLLEDKKIPTEEIDATSKSLSACEMAIYAAEEDGSVVDVRAQIGTLIEKLESLES